MKVGVKCGLHVLRLDLAHGRFALTMASQSWWFLVKENHTRPLNDQWLHNLPVPGLYLSIAQIAQLAAPVALPSLSRIKHSSLKSLPTKSCDGQISRQIVMWRTLRDLFVPRPRPLRRCKSLSLCLK